MVLPNFDAAVNAIKKRILVDASTGYAWDELLVNWFALYDRLNEAGCLEYFPTEVDGVEDGFVTNALFERWVVRFPGPTQKQLREARLSLQSTPLNHSDYSIQVITKIEKSGFIDVDWPRKDARAVNNCTPRRNAALGPYSWAFAKALQNTFDGGPLKWAMWTPGRSSEEVGSFFDRLTGHFGAVPDDVIAFLDGDQEAFDVHQNWGSIAIEGYLYRRAGLVGLMEHHYASSTPFGRHQKYNIVFNAGKPQRVTGDGRTSCGNVTISFLSVCHALGPPGPFTWGGIFNGDDFLIVTTLKFANRHVPNFHNRMAELGLSVKLNLTNEASQVTFCQTVPYPTPDGTIFAPKIGRLMSRIGVSTSFSEPTMKSIAMGLYVTCHHVPFIHQLLVKYLSLTEQHADVYVKEYKFHPQLNNFASRPHDTCGATWDFLKDRYGLTKEHLDSFQEVLDAAQTLPSILEWPIINSLVAIDE